MPATTVADLMVPLSEYATAHEDATLLEAVMALEEAQRRYERKGYRHRAILIYGRDGAVVGKLSHLDVVRALEPKYDQLAESSSLSRFGFSPEFLKRQMQEFDLWNQPLDDICRKGSQIKVRDVMYTPSTGEYVEAAASLDQAIHQLIMGRHQSLLVCRDERIVGILRTSDVFQHVCDRMKACGP